ncbi:MAG: hypothetical protein ABFD96_12445 [Armatimonadia bacterium]
MSPLGVTDPYAPTTDIAEAYRRCDPGTPLRGTHLERWYVDCADARGVHDFLTRLANNVMRAGGDGSLEMGRPYAHLAVSGHVGCGKSTDLRELQKCLEEERYAVVFVSTETEVSPEELDTEAIVLVTLQELVSQLEKRGVSLDAAKVHDVGRWFGEVIEEKTESKDAAAEISAQAGIGNSQLLKLLVGFRGYIRQATASKTTYKAEYRRYLSSLLGNLNDLFASARIELEKQDLKGPVLILDGPDKIKQRELQREVFVEYGELLGGLQAHLIMTAPIDIVCSPDVDTMRRWFNEPEILPSIQVDKPDFLATAMQIILRRCDAGLFEEGVIERLCQVSGGDVRHIIILTREALSRAPHAPVTMAHAEEAVSALSRGFAGWLRDDPERPEYRRLAKVSLDEESPVTDDLGRGLLVGSAVLCYSNGRRWYKVHPAIEPLRPFKRRLTELRAEQEQEPDEV